MSTLWPLLFLRHVKLHIASCYQSVSALNIPFKILTQHLFAYIQFKEDTANSTPPPQISTKSKNKVQHLPSNSNRALGDSAHTVLSDGVGWSLGCLRQYQSLIKQWIILVWGHNSSPLKTWSQFEKRKKKTTSNTLQKLKIQASK